MGISMLEAAKRSSTSKASIHRAIKAGHLSAERRQDGTFSIDPSELSRWTESRRETSRAVRPEPERVPAAETPETAAMAALAVEVRLLRERLDEMRGRSDELRAERDEWRTQAQRLALPDHTQKPPRWLAWLRA